MRNTPMTRRRFVGTMLTGAAGAVTLPVLGCGGGGTDGPTPTPTPTRSATPRPTATAPAPPSPTPTASPVPTSPGPAAWRRLDPATRPAARRDHVLVADAAGERLFLLGGRNGATALDDLWVYAMAGNTWERLAPGGEIPAPRFGHNGAYDTTGGRIRVFGGQAGSTFYDDAWSYDPTANRWERLPAGGPSPRYGAGSAFDPETGVLYVSHGFTNQGRFDDTWALAAGDGGWVDASASGTRPIPRCLLRCGWDAAGQIVLFGGQSNSAPYHDDLWVYGVDGGAWREVVPGGDRPGPRNLYAAVSDPSRRQFWVHGGRGPQGELADAWRFDAASETWSRVETAGTGPGARSGHDAALLPSGAVAVFGGSASGTDLDDLWLLEPAG